MYISVIFHLVRHSGSCIEARALPELPFALADTGRPTLVNLSKMKKLKDVVFRCETLRVGWIIAILEAITSKQRGFQQITIHIPHYLLVTENPARQTVGGEIYGEWADLDHLLVRFLESQAVRTKIVYVVGGSGEKWVCGDIGGLLPEITARGIIELDHQQVAESLI